MPPSDSYEAPKHIDGPLRRVWLKLTAQPASVRAREFFYYFAFPLQRPLAQIIYWCADPQSRDFEGHLSSFGLGTARAADACGLAGRFNAVVFGDLLDRLKLTRSFSSREQMAKGFFKMSRWLAGGLGDNAVEPAYSMRWGAVNGVRFYGDTLWCPH